MSATIVLHRNSRMLSWGDGNAGRLSRAESEVLQVLASNGDEYVSESALHRILWGPPGLDMVNSAKVRICRLRQRLRALGAPLVVDNLWGFGYRLSEPVEVEPPHIPERTVPLPASAMPPLRELLRRCSERTADAHLAERVRAEIRHAQEVSA